MVTHITAGRSDLLAFLRADRRDAAKRWTAGCFENAGSEVAGTVGAPASLSPSLRLPSGGMAASGPIWG